jgi:signal transduction histidine kinase
VAQVHQIRELIQEAIEKTRSLSRGLCPQPPQEQPLEALLEALALETEQIFGCVCRYKLPAFELPLSAERAANCYYVAREALQNAVRHGRADHIDMKLDLQGDQLVLTIRDNGGGFDITNDGDGLGLRSMAHRARLLDGELAVNSKPGEGSRIRLMIPCE